MLTLLGSRHPNPPADFGKLTRRSFLKVGGMAASGLSLAQLLALEAKAGTGRSHKAIINIFMPGGPSHLDTFDLKPDAPSEVRGEFRPIRTNVPGIEICELFPRLAAVSQRRPRARSIALVSGLAESAGGPVVPGPPRRIPGAMGSGPFPGSPRAGPGPAAGSGS